MNTGSPGVFGQTRFITMPKCLRERLCYSSVFNGLFVCCILSFLISSILMFARCYSFFLFLPFLSSLDTFFLPAGSLSSFRALSTHLASISSFLPSFLYFSSCIFLFHSHFLSFLPHPLICSVFRQTVAEPAASVNDTFCVSLE